MSPTNDPTPRPLTVTFLNQKGGVGKSTLCIAIGAILKQAGYRVAFDDRDPQGSVKFWAHEVGQIPLVEEEPAPEVVLCDTPGHISAQDQGPHAELCSLISRSDRLVIVAEKSLFSIHATTPMVRLVHAHRAPDSRVYLLLNKVRPGRDRYLAQESAVAFRLGVPLLTPFVPLSASFEHLQTKGISALKPPHLEKVLEIALQLVK